MVLKGLHIVNIFRVLRNCIDNTESIERKKEAKEKLNAAKEKVTIKSTKSLQCKV